MIFGLITLFFPAVLVSQDTNPKVSLKLDTRFDYTLKIPTTSGYETQSSFDGKYLNIILDGAINDKFSYNYRQRLILDGIADYRSFFNATDWMYLTYRPNHNWWVSGGKQVVAIGGFEYDSAPIDQYFWSDFWNQVICYQLGATVGAKSSNERHSVAFQITNSPFTSHSLQGIYAYNLIWYGHFNHFRTIYSVNRIEYAKGDYINYIALGNRFEVGKFSCEMDYMNRVADSQKSLFADFSVIGDMRYAVNDKVTAFVKLGYDENSAQPSDTEPAQVYDRFVVPGTKYFYCGAGAEYFPIKNNKDVRLHGYVASNNNDPQYLTLNVGVRWRMRVLER